MVEAQLFGRLLLQFDPKGVQLPEDLSAAVRTPDKHLWVAADEQGFLERLKMEEPRIYGDHTRFCVADYLDLDGADDGATEIDIEAVDHEDGHMWVVGSHSAKRKKPKGKSKGDDLSRLAEIEFEPSRFLLARIPLEDGALAKSKKSKAAMLPAGKDGGSLLRDLFEKDEHLAPFAQIPGKDNGLDIEGMAVVGDRVLLGLRGPVLRGYAILLELQLERSGKTLKLREDKKGRAFRKHFLELDGLGIRELTVRGDDLLILAGPTMAVDGPQRLFILPRATRMGSDGLHRQEKAGLRPLFQIPRLGEEKAEGVALFSWFDEEDSVLVVYDGPSEQRRFKKAGVFGDVFRLDSPE